RVCDIKARRIHRFHRLYRLEDGVGGIPDRWRSESSLFLLCNLCNLWIPPTFIDTHLQPSTLFSLGLFKQFGIHGGVDLNLLHLQRPAVLAISGDFHLGGERNASKFL